MEIVGQDAYLPILMITADIGREAKENALSKGARDFLLKPPDQTEVVLRVRNLIETRQLHVQLARQNEILEQAVMDRTDALWRAVTRLEQAQLDVAASREETINRLSLAAEYRDEATGAHIQRVSRYSALLARETGMSEDEAETIRLAAQLHDVGKIATPDRILLKQGPLDIEERALIESHAEIGFQLLAESDSDVLRCAATITRGHHERIDGRGYPRGLTGDRIPLAGRIVAIADVFDALTTDRVYRTAWPLERALAEMHAERGRHLDEALLDTFTRALPQIVGIKTRYVDTRGGGSLPHGLSRSATRMLPVRERPRWGRTPLHARLIGRSSC